MEPKSDRFRILSRPMIGPEQLVFLRSHRADSEDDLRTLQNRTSTTPTCIPLNTANLSLKPMSIEKKTKKNKKKTTNLGCRVQILGLLPASVQMSLATHLCNSLFVLFSCFF